MERLLVNLLTSKVCGVAKQLPNGIQIVLGLKDKSCDFTFVYLESQRQTKFLFISFNAILGNRETFKS